MKTIEITTKAFIYDDPEVCGHKPNFCDHLMLKQNNEWWCGLFCTHCGVMKTKECKEKFHDKKNQLMVHAFPIAQVEDQEKEILTEYAKQTRSFLESRKRKVVL